MELLNSTLRDIQPIDKNWYALAQKRLDNLTKPPGSLGRLEEIAKRLVAITENLNPVIDKKVIFVFAGDHGVTEEGVSAYPQEVTKQMIFNFINGGAGINVLARHASADVVVIDLGVKHDFEKSIHISGNCYFVTRKIIYGTKNIKNYPAMTRNEAIKCIETGIEIAIEYANKSYKIFCTGEMGIGNTTPSSAIASLLTGKPISEVTGRGTGIDDILLRKKIMVIEKAILLNKPDISDPIDILSKVGGAEIGGIAGLILGASAKKIPVVIDGFISTAGALIAYSIEPNTKDYMFAAHNSVEKGHKAILDKIGIKPILDLDLRLGEGTGAALALTIIEAGLKIYKEMATFDEAGISKIELKI